MGFNLNVEGTGRPRRTTSSGDWWAHVLAEERRRRGHLRRAAEPATIPRQRGRDLCRTAAGALNCDNPFHFFLFRAPEPDRLGRVPACRSPALVSNGSTEDANGNSSCSARSTGVRPSLVDVQFLGAVGGSFDVWVDDIRFYPCPGVRLRVPPAPSRRLPVACRGVAAGFPRAAGPQRATAPPVGGTRPGLHRRTGAAGQATLWTVGGPPLRHRGGTVGRWNGAAWSTALASTSERLWRASGEAAPDDVWAVGERRHNLSLGRRGLVAPVHQWNPRESLTRAVGKRSPTTSGRSGTGASMLHWDGVDVVTRGRARRRATGSVDVWGSGRDDVWAVGVRTDVVASTLLETGVMVHWDGSRWRVAPTGAPQVLRGLWGSGPDDAWGVGQGIVHWNGAAWTEHRTSEFFIQTLNAVWGNDRDDVWAVGTGGLIASLERRSLAQRPESARPGPQARVGKRPGGRLGRRLPWDGRSLERHLLVGPSRERGQAAVPLIDSRSRLGSRGPPSPHALTVRNRVGAAERNRRAAGAWAHGALPARERLPRGVVVLVHRHGLGRQRVHERSGARGARRAASREATSSSDGGSPSWSASN